MRGRRFLICTAGLLVAASAEAGDAPTPPDPYVAALAHARTIEQQLVTTIESACDTSVCVLNDQLPPETAGEKGAAPKKREPVTVAIGSGTIVRTGPAGAAKLWILTNHHVVEGSTKVEVITRDGVKRPAEIVDEVKEFDIALLRFTGPTEGLKSVVLHAKASADLDEGQWCFATGNPFGLAMDGRPVVTLGVISGKDRVLGGSMLYGRAIQHDAAVNHGNSGGALWNVKGEFLGINGRIATTGAGLAGGQQAANVGASFSIPVDEVDAFLARLTDPKKDARAGWLGLSAETDTDKAGKPIGVRVTNVDPRSPAAGPKGIQNLDVIESLTIVRPDGSKQYPIRTGTDLVNTLSLCPVGTKVTIRFHRAGKSDVLSWTGELGESK